MILLDTNLLGRLTDSADPQCTTARGSIHGLLARRERLIIVPQNLYELWAVATRKPGAPPAGQNGLGMTTEQASQWLAFFQRRFTLLPDREDLLARWHALVKAFGIKGFRSHDVRLVAAMQCYGITRLLTFNGDDFRGFPITVVKPASV
ncbi:MAG: type II toxin-antitoxin system VapC family toxin [Tepidisphaeraceae bacterium]|jgi:predicted nucleic acid-binding protein